MKQKTYITATLIIVAVLLLSGCTSTIGGTKIKDIITDPGKYEGSEVTVSGKVIEVIDIDAWPQEIKSYKINDGYASIEIISDVLPGVKKDDQVTAKGIVKANPRGVYIDSTVSK